MECRAETRTYCIRGFHSPCTVTLEIAQAALGAGFDVEKAMDYAKGYKDGQQIMASEIADLRARLAAVEAERDAALSQAGIERGALRSSEESNAYWIDKADRLATALAVHHKGTCTLCGLDQAREGRE